MRGVAIDQAISTGQIGLLSGYGLVNKKIFLNPLCKRPNAKDQFSIAAKRDSLIIAR